MAKPKQTVGVTARTTAHRAPTRTLSELITEAAQVLKSKDAARYAGVIHWMLAEDKYERSAAKPTRKRKTLLYSQRGEKIELYRDVVKRMEEK